MPDTPDSVKNAAGESTAAGTDRPLLLIESKKTFQLFRRSSPLTLNSKRRPVIRGVPTFFGKKFDLRGSECSGRRHSLCQHCFIKSLHQFGRRPIVNAPKTGDNT